MKKFKVGDIAYVATANGYILCEVKENKVNDEYYPFIVNTATYTEWGQLRVDKRSIYDLKPATKEMYERLVAVHGIDMVERIMDYDDIMGDLIRDKDHVALVSNSSHEMAINGKRIRLITGRLATPNGEPKWQDIHGDSWCYVVPCDVHGRIIHKIDEGE